MIRNWETYMNHRRRINLKLTLTSVQRKSLTKFCVRSPRDFSFLLSPIIKNKIQEISAKISKVKCHKQKHATERFQYLLPDFFGSESLRKELGFDLLF